MPNAIQILPFLMEHSGNASAHAVYTAEIASYNITHGIIYNVQKGQVSCRGHSDWHARPISEFEVMLV